MIKVNVEIDNKSWHKQVQKPQRYFNQKLRKISKINKFFIKKKIVFTILLTNSLNIKRLNRKFRKRNKSTDVLSFPTFSKKNLKLIREKKIYIGDLAASYEIILARAKSKNFLKLLTKIFFWMFNFFVPRFITYLNINLYHSYSFDRLLQF